MNDKRIYSFRYSAKSKIAVCPHREVKSPTIYCNKLTTGRLQLVYYSNKRLAHTPFFTITFEKIKNDLFIGFEGWGHASPLICNSAFFKYVLAIVFI